MRVFLISVLAVVVIAVIAVIALSSVQEPAGVKYTTSGARIDPGWSFRQVFTTPKSEAKADATAMAEGACNPSAWSFIRSDFRGSATADPACPH
jgi:hypothetical protein